MFICSCAYMLKVYKYFKIIKNFLLRGYWSITLYIFHVYNTIYFNFVYTTAYTTFTTKSLVFICYHTVTYLVFSFPSFASGNHYSFLCNYVFGLVCSRLIYLFSIYEWNQMVFVFFHIVFIHSSVDGHLARTIARTSISWLLYIILRWT